LLGEKELMRMLQMEQEIGKSFAMRKLGNFNYNEPSGNNKNDSRNDSRGKPSFKRKPQGKKPNGKKSGGNAGSRGAKPRRKR
jgi:hypothetical protein